MEGNMEILGYVVAYLLGLVTMVVVAALVVGPDVGQD